MLCGILNIQQYRTIVPTISQPHLSTHIKKMSKLPTLYIAYIAAEGYRILI